MYENGRRLYGIVTGLGVCESDSAEPPVAVRVREAFDDCGDKPFHDLVDGLAVTVHSDPEGVYYAQVAFDTPDENATGMQMEAEWFLPPAIERHFDRPNGSVDATFNIAPTREQIDAMEPGR